MAWATKSDEIVQVMAMAITIGIDVVYRDIFFASANGTLKAIPLKGFGAIDTPLFVVWLCLATAPKVTLLSEMGKSLVLVAALARASYVCGTCRYGKLSVANLARSCFGMSFPSRRKIAFHGAIDTNVTILGFVKSLSALLAITLLSCSRAICRNSFESFVPRLINLTESVSNFTAATSRAVNLFATSVKDFFALWACMFHVLIITQVSMNSEYLAIARARIDHARRSIVQPMLELT